MTQDDSYTNRTTGPGTPSLHGTIEQQVQLPFKNAVEIAWRNIRVRLARSLLVTSGIILSLAFLTYILCSDSLTRSFVHKSAEGGRRCPPLSEVLRSVKRRSDAERQLMR